MNNIIMRRVPVAADYQPVVTESLVASVTISTPPGNQATVYFKGDDGSDVPWAPGEWHVFRSVDLSTVQIKGTDGDIVTVVGGTW